MANNMESIKNVGGNNNPATAQPLPRLWNANYIKVWSANFMIFFSFMLVMPLLPLYLSEQYGAGKHTIGLILSGYTITALIARLFSGYVVDSFPRRTVLLLSYSLFSFFFLGYLVGGPLLLFAIVRTLHGAPFGSTTVANSTVAIDVLHPQRRAEGIGFYGLSNNLATAISPSIGLYIYEVWGNFQAIFFLSFLFSLCGVIINSTVKFRQNKVVAETKQPDNAIIESDKEAEKASSSAIHESDNPQHESPCIYNKVVTLKEKVKSLDRFFLLNGWSEGVMLACLSFSYGVLSTYLAIYGKETMGITSGTGTFFLILSLGLMASRLTGSRSLRKGRVVRNATLGMTVSVFSYIIFAAVHNPIGYYGCALILGLGNGHMFPAVQTMFVNLAPHSRRGTANSSLLTSWDVGIGLGIVFGGVISEAMGYQAAFWMAAIVNVIGVVFYYAYVRRDYMRKRLR